MQSAKFTELAAYKVVAAFCMSFSIEIASERSGLSWKTTKALYVDLRERLFHPHFNRWHRLNAHADFESFRFLMEDVVRYFYVLGKCAEKKACHRNYALGNRANRVCRSCPLLENLDPGDVDGAVASLHRVQDFYKMLDWRAENDEIHGQVMMKRTYHHGIHHIAYSQTKFAKSGFPSASDDGYLSVAALFQMMIGSLSRYPLRSQAEPEPWGTPLPVEPIHPEVMRYLFFDQ
ncbi:hypothetical protein [Rhizobium terrae]|uniref:hypothetical protein n=1 Tax=Rhizobium terrae TaxID=2171756 RepID=UPI000E3EC99F|nr:hypothetical protein [Rhizobium terrae]